MKFIFFFLMAIAVSFNNCFAQDWKTYPYQPTGSVITFPKDEGRHVAEPIEWWYTSGHFTGATTGKTYSFMLTYFYYPALTFDGFRILNITDDATGEFYEDTKPVNYNSLAAGHLDIDASVYTGGAEKWSTKVDANQHLIPFEYTLHAFSPAVNLELNSKSLKRPLILDEDGYLDQGLANYTYYYSLTRNSVSGKLTLNGITEEVNGTSWIDRQYGNFNPRTGEKYEWFQLQLSNGMDVNLWNIFTTDDSIPDNKRYRILAAYVNDNTQYTNSNFKLERLGYNWMPDSAMCYSNKWRLTSDVNKIDLIITTKNNNTEMKFPFRFYEGATIISGTVNGVTVTGVGFAELLHSYEPAKLIIKNPAGGKYEASSPISWQLSNPDDGRPLVYDIEYSIDNKITFKPLAQGVKDTFYLWNHPTVADGKSIWFKIIARSVDNKLNGSVTSMVASTVVNQGSSANKIKLYPNPVKDYLFVEPGYQMDNPPCDIIDASGRVIRSLTINTFSNKIDVSQLNKGAYYLRIHSEDGKIVLKFIKN